MVELERAEDILEDLDQRGFTIASKPSYRIQTHVADSLSRSVIDEEGR
jgi:hypothetical protein